MKKRKSNLIGMIGFLVIVFLSSFVGGFLGGLLLEDKSYGVLGIIYVLVIFTLSFMLHIILHEAGHLIFGLLTNYDFLSFRVGSLTYVKYNGRINRKRFKVKGTAGQCLMVPKAETYEESPFLLYNLGGLIINIIITLVAVTLLVFTNANNFLKEAYISLIVSGVFVILTNGIPMKIGGVANDAYNIASLLKDKNSRYCFYMQLKVNALNHTGTRLKEIPLEWLQVPMGSDLSNPIISSLKCLEANYYHDNGQFDKAKECYEYLLENSPGLIKLLEYEINCELLFYEIIGEQRADLIDNLYNKDLKRYINATECYIGRKRLMYAYELLYKKDKKAAGKVYKNIDKCIGTYPSKGEILSEIEIVNLIKGMEKKEVCLE